MPHLEPSVRATAAAKAKLLATGMNIVNRSTDDTIRVCRIAGVPVGFQGYWVKWTDCP